MAGVQHIDDVLVQGNDQTEHDQRLEAVLMRLWRDIQPKQMPIQHRKVKFFGHHISSSGIEADPEKVQAIADLLPPQNV